MRLSWLIVVRDFVVPTFVRDDCHDRDVVVVEQQPQTGGCGDGLAKTAKSN